MGDDANPFLGMAVHRPAGRPAFKWGPISLGLAPVLPHTLVELAAGRGTVRNVERGDGAAGPILLDYRPFAATTDMPAFHSLAAFRMPGIPELQLAPRTRFTVGFKPLEFPAHPRFNARFMLLANDEPRVRPLFCAAVLDACAAMPPGTDWQLQAGSGWLLAACAGTGDGVRAALSSHGSAVADALRHALDAAPR